jgi:hypothetical protein
MKPTSEKKLNEVFRVKDRVTAGEELDVSGDGTIQQVGDGGSLYVKWDDKGRIFWVEPEEVYLSESKINEGTTWWDIGWDKITGSENLSPDLTGYSVISKTTGATFKVERADEKSITVEGGKRIGVGELLSSYELVNPDGDEVKVDMRESKEVDEAKSVKKEDGWHVISPSGKDLGGPYKSEGEANRRKKDVEFYAASRESKLIEQKDVLVKIIGGEDEGKPGIVRNWVKGLGYQDVHFEGRKKQIGYEFLSVAGKSAVEFDKEVDESKINELGGAVQKPDKEEVEDKNKDIHDIPSKKKEDHPDPETVVPKEEEEAAFEIEKEYLGKTDDEHFYLVFSEDDIQILNQEGILKFSAKDNDLPISDQNAFVLAALQEVKMESIERSVFMKYLLPLLLEEEPVEELEEPSGDEIPEIGKDKEEDEEKPVESKISEKFDLSAAIELKEFACFKLFGKSGKECTSEEYKEAGDFIMPYLEYKEGKKSSETKDKDKKEKEESVESKVEESKNLIEMKVSDSENTFEVNLVADDSDGAVIDINNREFRFDEDFVSLWKDDEGKITEEGLTEMALDAIANLEEEDYAELVAASITQQSTEDDLDDEAEDNVQDKKPIESKEVIAEKDVSNYNDEQLERILSHLESVARVGFDVGKRMQEVKAELAKREGTKESKDTITQVNEHQWKVITTDNSTVEDIFKDRLAGAAFLKKASEGDIVEVQNNLGDATIYRFDGSYWKVKEYKNKDEEPEDVAGMADDDLDHPDHDEEEDKYRNDSIHGKNQNEAKEFGHLKNLLNS